MVLSSINIFNSFIPCSNWSFLIMDSSRYDFCTWKSFCNRSLSSVTYHIYIYSRNMIMIHHLSIDLSIRPYIYQSINQSIYLSIHPSKHPSMWISIYLSYFQTQHGFMGLHFVLHSRSDGMPVTRRRRWW